MIIFMFLYKNLKYQGSLEFLPQSNESKQNVILLNLPFIRPPTISTQIKPLDQRTLHNILEEREGRLLQ